MSTVNMSFVAYHHGDLRNALVQAGIELAREGGPDAVVLREAARRIGVSPTAAYRHFRDHDDLLATIGMHAHIRLAASMTAAVAAARGSRDPALAALRRFRAVGRAYVDFAAAEPGLFKVAFSPTAPAPDPSDCPSSFELLQRALDDLVATGALGAERRDGADIAAWAMVHGIATLLVDGPLGEVGVAGRARMVERCLDTIVTGL